MIVFVIAILLALLGVVLLLVTRWAERRDAVIGVAATRTVMGIRWAARAIAHALIGAGVGIVLVIGLVVGWLVFHLFGGFS